MYISKQEDTGATTSPSLSKKPVKPKTEEGSGKRMPEKVDPISKEVLDKFTEDLLPGCLKMLVDMPDTVYTVHDLIAAVASRNGEKWKNNVLEEICQEVL